MYAYTLSFKCVPVCVPTHEALWYLRDSPLRGDEPKESPSLALALPPRQVLLILHTSAYVHSCTDDMFACVARVLVFVRRGIDCKLALLESLFVYKILSFDVGDAVFLYDYNLRLKVGIDFKCCLVGMCACACFAHFIIIAEYRMICICSDVVYVSSLHLDKV